MRMWKTQAIWSLLIIFELLSLFLRTSGIRNDIGFQQKHFCRNTVQGRYLLSDDNGYVCSSLSVDIDSRCCPQSGAKFSCHGCDHLSQCCDSYEYCVSCCLNPSKTIKNHIMKLKIAKPTTAGTYSSVFDFCVGRCRHNSESVVHENAYLSNSHHCFSMPSMPRGNINFAGSELVAMGENSTQPDSRLNGINVIVGRQGESCDSVCKLSGQSCVPNKLLLLNQCEIMRKFMRCATCLESIGADQPAVVVDNAPKHLNPGACLYTRTQSTLSCDGYHHHTRRLCPCA